jgi:hypothetical protein
MYLSTSNKTLNKYKVEEHYREEIQQITPLLLNVTIISNGKNKNYRLHEKKSQNHFRDTHSKKKCMIKSNHNETSEKSN